MKHVPQIGWVDEPPEATCEYLRRALNEYEDRFLESLSLDERRAMVLLSQLIIQREKALRGE